MSNVLDKCLSKNKEQLYLAVKELFLCAVRNKAIYNTKSFDKILYAYDNTVLYCTNREQDSNNLN